MHVQMTQIIKLHASYYYVNGKKHKNIQNIKKNINSKVEAKKTQKYRESQNQNLKKPIYTYGTIGVMIGKQLVRWPGSEIRRLK